MVSKFKTQKKVIYYPRECFWKFWEPKKIHKIYEMIDNNDRITKKFCKYDSNGLLRSISVGLYDMKLGSCLSFLKEVFHPNGKLWKNFTNNRIYIYDNRGTLIELVEGDKKVFYYSSGRIRAIKNTKTNEFVQYEDKGSFYKEQDPIRQSYNQLLKDVNQYSPDSKRKLLKRRIALCFRKSKRVKE